MPNSDSTNPFHAGELEAQSRAGVGDVAQWAGGFIRDYLPEQHRDFHTNLPFLVVAGADVEGRTWITLIEGQDNFVQSPDPQYLTLATELSETDPLAVSFDAGMNIGVLGIELETRRRNRFSGFVSPSDQGYSIAINQSFGNCPQHIHPRNWTRVPQSINLPTTHSKMLNDTQISRIQNANTMFIGSGQLSEKDEHSRGYDASHRGGESGFIKAINGTQLQIPDYAGNNFFNTIGNLISDPRIGLLFVDFETGALLHITGRASIDWQPHNAHYAGAQRLINVEVDTVIDRPQAISLRWTKREAQLPNLKLIAREKESTYITSFYFSRADGQDLKPFEAGQHLPIEVQIPGQTGISKRSYSLSGSPKHLSYYRLSVKRENKGLVSSFLHDALHPGSTIKAQQPSDGFVIPCHTCPLVLVSAGVGQTPMLSMLYSTAEQESSVWYIHGTRNGANHALHEEVSQLVELNANLRKKIFYSQPDESDVLGRDYDIEGRITAEYLRTLNAGADTHYMLCGPMTFLADLRNGLDAAGVPESQIHFETFGSGS